MRSPHSGSSPRRALKASSVSPSRGASSPRASMSAGSGGPNPPSPSSRQTKRIAKPDGAEGAVAAISSGASSAGAARSAATKNASPSWPRRAQSHEKLTGLRATKTRSISSRGGASDGVSTARRRNRRALRLSAANRAASRARASPTPNAASAAGVAKATCGGSPQATNSGAPFASAAANGVRARRPAHRDVSVGRA